MPGRQVVGVALALASAVVAAGCGSSGEDRPPPLDGTGGSGNASTGGAGGGSGGSAAEGGQPGGGTGGDGGQAGSGGAPSGGAGGAGGTSSGGEGGTGGAGGVSTDPVCGNDIAEAGEECDGPDFDGARCADYGFDEGSLTCTSDCLIAIDGCSGTERCSDGRDNDGDGEDDCSDPDCAAACSDGCAYVDTITLPTTITSAIDDHASSVDSSCAAETGSADVVYGFEAPKNGFLDVALDTNAALTVSLRTACGGGTELFCGIDSQSHEVTQGQTYYVHVDGLRQSSVGAFSLELAVLSTLCGNSDRDPGEECDDGFAVDGDGCSRQCTVEPDEDSDNDSPDTADLYSELYDAHITAGDEDWVAFVIPEDNTGVLVEVIDWGDGGCLDGLQDSNLEIYASDGTTVLASNDDDLTLCSRVVLSAGHPFGRNLDAGTYYARVTATPVFPNETFPYRLQISADRCGNGVRGATEACDDGNEASGDGCSSTCRLE